jgi:CBS domain-containing protein
LVVGIGGYLQPRAFGVGYDVIADLLNNRIALMAVLALIGVKAGIWLVSLASGTSGGVLAPLLILGAGLGAAIAHFFPEAGVSAWPLVCLAAVLAGAIGIPLTATVVALVLTADFGAVLPLLLACGVAHGLTALIMRRSIMTERISRRGLHIHREYSVDPHERMAVHEVMTHNPVCIDAKTSLAEASRDYFGDDQRYRHYPVMDGKRLVGILDRETLRLALRDSDADDSCATPFRNLDPAVVLPTDTCQIAARRMALHDLQCLAVVKDDDSRELVGLLSRSDLIKPANEGFHEEEVKERIWGGS